MHDQHRAIPSDKPCLEGAEWSKKVLAKLSDPKTILAGAYFFSMLTLALGIFFRAQIQNGWTVFFGDRTDAGIEVAILEHWFNFFNGTSGWASTFYFFPVPAGLGYNDGYLIYGALYSAFRLVGSNPFFSAELVNVTVKSIGFVSLFFVLRHIIRASLLLSLVGATVFTISNNSYLQAIHAQLFSVTFAPLLWILLHNALRSSLNGRARSGTLWSMSASLLFSSWMLTSFYMAWFFSFFCGVAVIVYCFTQPEHAKQVWHARRHCLYPAAIGAATLLVGLLPFVALYMPKAAETGMHSFSAAMAFSPSILDTFNVGPNNWLYGRAVTHFNTLLRPDISLEGERASGLPPLTIVLFLCATLHLWFGRSLKGQVLGRTLALASLITWMLSLHYGSFTPWRWIYQYVPGAGAVRVISRYQIFLVVPVVAVVLTWLNAVSSRIGSVGVVTLGMLLIVGELNFSYPIGLVSAAEMARLDAVPKVPSGCNAFATLNVRPGPLSAAPEVDRVYSHNVDAMLIAEYIRLPTVNGMASFVPPSWNFSASESPDYVGRVLAYSAKHGIGGLCTLDLRTLRWGSLE